MKLLLAVLASIAYLSSAAQLKEGDNLQTEYKKIAVPYYFKGPDATPWVEGKNLLMISAFQHPNQGSYLLIALQDSTRIGVLNLTQPNFYLFDNNSSSLLNTSSDIFLLPEWVVKRQTKILPKDNTILSLLDKMYEATLQSDDNQMDEKTLKKYESYRTDTTLANRHIALLFDNYQNAITHSLSGNSTFSNATCLRLITELSEECHVLYGRVPVIISIYMGEALLSSNMEDKARKYFKDALKLYPNSIPLKVYNYRLEENAEKKETLLAELKKKYPGHWMVKDL